MNCPLSHNLAMIELAIASGRREYTHSGCFKWAMRVNLLGTCYALKWGRSQRDALNDMFSHCGGDSLGEGGMQHPLGGELDGQDDLMLEVAMQVAGCHLPLEYLNTYVAWGVVGSCFYALQPWLQNPRELEFSELRDRFGGSLATAVTKFHRALDGWRTATGLEAVDVDALLYGDSLHLHNAGITQDNQLRIYDWGWAVPRYWNRPIIDTLSDTFTV